jgi:hypothetical protein
MKIEIETADYRLASDFDSQTEIPGGAVIASKSEMIRRMEVDSHLIELVITFSSGVSTSLIATWIYDKLKGRASRVRINRKEVKFDKGQIEKILIEEIEKGK